MANLICNNNKYLQNLTLIPINGIPAQVLTTVIILDKEADPDEHNKMTVQEYIQDADWCLGLEPTNTTGRYLLITTKVQLAKACNWLEKNLKVLFIQHIPQYGSINPIDGHPFLT